MSAPRAVACDRCGSPVDTLDFVDEHFLCSGCVEELLKEYSPADLRPIRLRGARLARLAEQSMAQVRRSHSPCCGGRVGGCRDEFREGAPLARSTTLKLARKSGPEANRLTVYYHPALEVWVACLGDPAAPILSARQPSSVGALAELLTAVQSSGHRFDEDWQPF